ncbi:MAG TPA: hypothetical protein VNM22_05715 [Candidatus Limnocylindrales bacterium]|nr:hypothetical protein [Candidatus Limnocylindrales bacterium]
MIAALKKQGPFSLKKEYTLEELISIFSEEVSKAYKNSEYASVLAMDALIDFVNMYSDNVIIDGISYPILTNEGVFSNRREESSRND